MSMVNVQNLGFGGSGIPDALPKAVAELQNLKVSLVDGAAAGTVVPVAGMDPEDHIGAVIDLTTPAAINISTITVSARNASATITCLTTAVDGDKVTVNGKPYTFKNIKAHPSYNAPPGVVPIDVAPSVPAQMAERLAKAIMSGDSTLTASYAAAVVTVKVRQPGTAGNATTLTETGNAVTISGATFTGGAAEASGGFSSSAVLTGKKLLVFWYDKRPGQTTAPLEFEGRDSRRSEEGREEDREEPRPDEGDRRRPGGDKGPDKPSNLKFG